MKKIIYLMNVDWKWIKQRPHFLVERLSEKYDLIAAYQHRYHRKGLQKRYDKQIKLFPLYVVPVVDRISSLKWINKKILTSEMNYLIRKINPDVIILTFPTQIIMIPSNYTGRIIYDCMDNHAAFIENDIKRKQIEEKEALLLKRSSIVFASSNYIAAMIKNKYQVSSTKIQLLRNAYDGKILNIKKNSSVKSYYFKLAYVGTISDWFDWETIMHLIESQENIEFHIYGPVSKGLIPNKTQIIYHGTIEHEDIYNAVEDIDILVMPFKINEIIKAVDPVKLYEYINFNKNIIVSKFDEISRFEPFVYFYSTKNEFVEIVKQLQSNNVLKYSTDKRIEFLSENSWDCRVNEMCSIIDLL